MDVVSPEPTDDPDAVAALLRRRVGESGLTVPVAGSSMAGTIESGSLAMIAPSDSPRPGQVWAFVDGSGRLVVHRIRTISADAVTHRGVGNSRDDQPVGRSRMVGRVVSSTSDGHTTKFGKLDAFVALLGFRARSVARALGLRRPPNPSG